MPFIYFIYIYKYFTFKLFQKTKEFGLLSVDNYHFKTSGNTRILLAAIKFISHLNFLVRVGIKYFATVWGILKVIKF